MAKNFIDDQDFDQAEQLEIGEFENCRFKNCAFAEADFSGFVFSESTFEDCDLSNATVRNAAFRGVHFKNCKLLGLRFDEVNTFGLALDFEDCQLEFASFYGLKIGSTVFKNCLLSEAEFVGADCTSAIFDGCDLRLATFENTKLDGADFRTAIGFEIDPEKNTIRKARFSRLGLAGLLAKYRLEIE